MKGQHLKGMAGGVLKGTASPTSLMAGGLTPQGTEDWILVKTLGRSPLGAVSLPLTALVPAR